MVIFLSIAVLLIYILLTASLQGVHEPGHVLKLPPQGWCCREGAAGHVCNPILFPRPGGGVGGVGGSCSELKKLIFCQYFKRASRMS